MKATASIRLIIAILMPASLCAAEPIRIETKILGSEVTRIPHDLAEVAKMEGVEILTAPSITTGFSNNAKAEILRNDVQPIATQRKLESPSPGLTISVTPERQGEDIAFNGCLTMTELVGEANREHQTQSDTKQWIPNSVEIQIADPFAEKWAKAHPTLHGGGVFGHLAPTQQVTRKPGEWNRMTIQAHGQLISVWLNGAQTVSMDLAQWTSNKTNPDGSAIPGWLKIPKAELPTKGRIGLQGKHGPATIWFRNIRIREDAPAGGSKP